MGDAENKDYVFLYATINEIYQMHIFVDLTYVHLTYILCVISTIGYFKEYSNERPHKV